MRTRDLNEREGRSLALLRFGHDDTEFLQQRVTPRHALRADLVLQLGDRVPCVWGPVAALLRDRRTVVEFVSGHLAMNAARRHFAESLFLGDPTRPASDCQLLTICSQVPRARLHEAGSCLEPGPVAGVWVGDLGAFGRWVVVAVNRLPVVPGTSVLRLTRLRHKDSELRQGLAHLLTDPDILPTIRYEIMEGIRMNKIPSSNQERELTARELVQLGRNEGRAEGVREALLALARAWLSADEVQALEQLSNPELEVAVREAPTRGGLR